MARSQGIISLICQTLLTAGSNAQSSLQGTETDTLIDGTTAWVEDKQATYKWIPTQLLTPVADKVINGLNGGQWVIVDDGVDPVEVYTLNDLPAAVAGVITLVNGRTYRVHGTVGLGAAVITMGLGSVLQGVGSAQLTTNNAISLATGTVGGACSVLDICLLNTGGPAFEWAGNGNSSQCVLRDSQFYGLTAAVLVLGVANDYINLQGCTFVGTTIGLQVAGVWDSVALDNCRFLGVGDLLYISSGNVGDVALMLLSGCEFQVTGAADIGILQQVADAVAEGRITGNLFSVTGGGAATDGVNVVGVEWVSTGNAGLGAI